MPAEEQSFLTQAAQCWANGESLAAGKLIYENLPSDARPRWAARILRLVLEHSSMEPSLFQEVLMTADNEALWQNGHRVFSALRNMTLRLDQRRQWWGLRKHEELLAEILLLAELVAKVTYNATEPLAPFDEDSGWWLASSLRSFVDRPGSDERLKNAAWAALCAIE